jgi:hypothetical protein
MEAAHGYRNSVFFVKSAGRTKTAHPRAGEFVIGREQDGRSRKIMSKRLSACIAQSERT